MHRCGARWTSPPTHQLTLTHPKTTELHSLPLSHCLSLSQIRTNFDLVKVKSRACGSHVLFYNRLYLSCSCKGGNKKRHLHYYHPLNHILGVGMGSRISQRSQFLLFSSGVGSLFMCDICSCAVSDDFLRVCGSMRLNVSSLSMHVWGSRGWCGLTNKDGDVLLWTAASPQGCSLPCANTSHAGCMLGKEPCGMSTNVRLVPRPWMHRD